VCIGIPADAQRLLSGSTVLAANVGCELQVSGADRGASPPHGLLYWEVGSGTEAVQLAAFFDMSEPETWRPRIQGPGEFLNDNNMVAFDRKPFFLFGEGVAKS
jgi:hypothetical protein